MNFLTLMGYSIGGDREVYSLDQIIKEFDYKRIGISGAVFDVTKLDWINQHYLINNIPQDNLWGRLKEWTFNDSFMESLMPLCHSRIKTFGDFMELCDFFFINHLKYTHELFNIKGVLSEQACFLLQAIIWHLDEQENWEGPGMYQASKEVAEIFGVNHKKVIMPLLFASLMGKLQGPPLFDSVTLLGKDRTRARLLNAMEFLGGISHKKMSQLKKHWDERACHSMMSEAQKVSS